MLQNAHAMKLSFYGPLISCDLGVVCFKVHGL